MTHFNWLALISSSCMIYELNIVPMKLYGMELVALSSVHQVKLFGECIESVRVCVCIWVFKKRASTIW